MIVEDGDVNGEFMDSRRGELVDNERGHGRGTGVDDEGRRWEAMTIGRGGESKRIYVRQGKKIRQTSQEELAEWVGNRGGNTVRICRVCASLW